MGSLDTAVLFSDYAHYMTASQKIVPGAGMNYRTLAESFACNDDAQLGKILCDSYMENCSALTVPPCMTRQGRTSIRPCGRM
jgi:hypothetical protein